MAFTLYAARVWRSGNSIVFPLFKSIREAIGAHPDDLLIIRVHPPYITLRRADPNLIVPLDELTTADLPPAWPGRRPIGAIPTDQAGSAAPAAGTAPRDDE